ncbi:hypothetical protein [Wolbachia endosymbiont of Frankliniella intonsa]|uniref:hypothetical protein n=1 Tax=Wolbachia endosymbiont of Frankliniella intonsa TaxID=2902422 RepID=UPI00244E7D2A|nr:hypothetical protein [Wolbachia endosymbiont of Frankliniella intonsa]WGJ62189.1 hypothetical protein M3L71_00255 [Wolbachia endosymbiont of Frankliniella intonsa]
MRFIAPMTFKGGCEKRYSIYCWRRCYYLNCHLAQPWLWIMLHFIRPKSITDGTNKKHYKLV